MRKYLAQVRLTVSTFRPSFSPQSKVYPQSFDSCNPCAPKSPFVFNRLRTLYLSCRSFCDSCPLFSITSALFDKNTRGGIPALPSASTALIIPTGSKGFNGPWVRFPSSPLPHLRPLLRSPPFCVSTFRINTSKSVSKQTTLTSFRMNTGSVDILPDEGMPQAIEVVGKTEQQGLANLYR